VLSEKQLVLYLLLTINSLSYFTTKKSNVSCVVFYLLKFLYDHDDKIY